MYILLDLAIISRNLLYPFTHLLHKVKSISIWFTYVISTPQLTQEETKIFISSKIVIFFLFSSTKSENSREMEQVLQGDVVKGVGISRRSEVTGKGCRYKFRVWMYTQYVCENDTSWTIPGMGGGCKGEQGRVNSSIIHLIHCKNFCKCHSVPPLNTIKNIDRRQKRRQ
jgi:hypothetical protein